MVEPLMLIPVACVVLLTLGVVFARNPITSAFCLIGVMLTLAIIYAMIGAHFIAALQAIVYAGAIMVLFVFSIMLLNMNETKSEIALRSKRTWAAVAVFVTLLGLVARAIWEWSLEERLPTAGPWTLERIRDIGGNSLAVSASLFSEFYIQFELISLLLLVAIAGALVLAKRKVD